MIIVQREDFEVGIELKRLTEGNNEIGGVCSFIGLVRDSPDKESLEAMTLQHYPGMTEKELNKIDDEAHGRWPLEASLIIHRYGRLQPGEQIVLVATASAHRKAAFEACEFLIDFLKTRAPFWKKEDYGSVTEWVGSLEADNRATEKWYEKKQSNLI